MQSLNRASLIGHLTKDPEIRQTATGKEVLTCSIATNSPYKDGNEWKEKPEFHNIVIWGKDAAYFHKTFHKGSRVSVEGRLQTRDWEKDGIKRYSTEIVVDKIY